jgi:hypothetical protein
MPRGEIVDRENGANIQLQVVNDVFQASELEENPRLLLRDANGRNVTHSDMRVGLKKGGPFHTPTGSRFYRSGKLV